MVASTVILADTSVWIAYFRNLETETTTKLEAAASREQLLVGDVILLEILQGARDDVHAARLERALSRFTMVSVLDPVIASRAAANYRTLRGLGITIRKTTDLIIGTFCIEHGHRLLHDDRDFIPMERHLGLKTL